MQPGVHVETAGIRVFFTTILADVLVSFPLLVQRRRRRVVVGGLMGGQLGLLDEAPPALAAGVGSLAGVGPLVRLQVALASEGLRTELAAVGPLSRVGPHVYLERSPIVAGPMALPGGSRRRQSSWSRNGRCVSSRSARVPASRGASDSFSG